jgi:adenylosuccinate lyase
MAAIWAPVNRYRIWFEIEALAAEGMARVGAIPETAARTIRKRPQAGRHERGRCRADRRDRARPATTSSPS